MSDRFYSHGGRAIRRAAALMLLGSVSAQAVGTADGAAGSAAQSSADPGQQPIIVTAPPLFRDVQPERSLDEQAIAGYGVSTVDELLDEVQGELGDDEQPLILVNGERINAADQIGGLPV